MKKFIQLNLLLMAFIVITSETLQAQKFGYVNSNMLLAELPATKQAEAQLAAYQQMMQKQYQQKLEQLQSDYSIIQQKIERGELSPVQQEEKNKEMQNRQLQLSKSETEMNNNFQDKRVQLLEPIYKIVNDAIKAVSKENGYQMIFEQGAVLFAEEYLDVTNLVKAKLGM